MECKVYEFAKIDKKEKRNLRKAYYWKQWFDILISYIFILISSSKPFFSFKNGALWVVAWYTFSLLLSCYTYVNQIEYNIGRKRAKHYSKKHPNCTLQKSVEFSPEVGGWTLLGSQFLCVLPLTIGLGIFAFVYGTFFYETYMMEYKDFCIGLALDTYVLVFFLIYFTGFWRELRYIHGVKNKVKAFLVTFPGSKCKNIVIHLAAIIICIFALKHYLINEFSGLFNETERRIIGIVYILYMILPKEEIMEYFREINKKKQKERRK
ncbi:MAG: hypothetical protein K1W24_00330 [Lachnospiraceae bacterium]